MSTVAEQMTSAEASRLLGVSVRQVERLVAAGDLTRVGRVGRSLLIDAASVHRMRGRGSRRGRPWAAETKRAAADLLAEGRTERLTQAERSRLRSRLRGMTAEEPVQAMSGRAQVRRLRASGSFLDRLRQSVTLTGAAAVDADRAVAGRFGLASAQRDTVDGYVDADTAQRLIDECHLVDDANGNVTLRITDDHQGDRMLADDVTVALDLADSLDARERSAGLALLRSRLRAL